MALSKAALRPRGGLLAALVALAVAVGVVLAVGGFTGTSGKHPSVAVGQTGSVRTGTSQSAGAGSASAGASVPTTAAPLPKVKVVAEGVVKGLQSWQQPLDIQVSHGTLLAVKTTDDTGLALAGSLSSSGWISTGEVIPNRTYEVQTYVLGLDGVKSYHTVTVETSPAQETVGTNVTVQVGPAVGIGWPIVVKFTRPVTNRAAVEQALQVTTSSLTPIVGAWHWFSDVEVHYRPEYYWPAHTQLVLHDHLTAVEAAPGVWGDSDRDVAFNVGDAHVTTVDVATQHMTVTDNGNVVSSDTDNGKPVTYDKVSTGRPSLPTLGGVHIVLEKWASIEMNSETLIPPIHKLLPNGKKNPLAYDETELWATRISDAGAFVHYNPKTLEKQGHAAASHGCVNTGLKQAEQFYNLSLPGDIVIVEHSPAPPNVTDPGMMDWNYSWAQWLAGSATQS